MWCGCLSDRCLRQFLPSAFRARRNTCHFNARHEKILYVASSSVMRRIVRCDVWWCFGSSQVSRSLSRACVSLGSTSLRSYFLRLWLDAVALRCCYVKVRWMTVDYSILKVCVGWPFKWEVRFDRDNSPTSLKSRSRLNQNTTSHPHMMWLLLHSLSLFLYSEFIIFNGISDKSSTAFGRYLCENHRWCAHHNDGPPHHMEQCV